MLNDPAALNCKAAVFVRLGNLEEAEKIYRRLTLIDPLNPNHFDNLASILVSKSRIQEALDIYEELVLRHPDHFYSRAHFAALLLLLGDYKRGFTEYEYRIHLFSSQKKILSPRWKGENIEGKTLLVSEEQGYGDIIQFLRYIPYLAKTGCKIILAIQPSLHSLFAYLPFHLISPQAPYPQHDFHVYLMSLASIFQTELASIPPPIPIKGIGWKPSKSRIGVVWKGNPNQRADWARSLDVQLLKPLFEIKGLEFISLQKEISQKEADFLDAYQIKKGQMDTWKDTAQEIAQCERVISIESAVGHLAATLGTPTWLLTPQCHCWRWMLHRKDSPWYHTVKLFRQSIPGNWRDPIHLLSQCLQGI